ncbi:hypothetical protein HZA96_02750 [Candidatus Woesearchaeota archaeon]|nr:hypothetical protein [Candidatus Woesearchaeota archaeon]
MNQQQSKSNVSIGKIGEPFYDEISDRVKYFSVKEYQDSAEIKKDIDAARELQIKKNASRMTMRAIITAESSNALDLTSNDVSIEAIIPLHTWDNHVLLYLANNNSSRVCDKETLNKEDNQIENVNNAAPSILQLPVGYSIEKLNDSISLADAEQLAALYKQVFREYMCEFTQDSVKQLVNGNLVYAARSPEDQLVSIVIAELSSLEVNGRKLLVTELSDMATLTDFRGLGLNRFCADKILPQVKHFDLVYAEARACFYGSNKIFKNLGFEYGGRLIKHCLISSDKTIEEKGNYENLNVWYLKRGEQ